MKLYVWRGETTNFGDELNRLLWPALLPGFFDEDESAIVLGIGSVLDCRHAPDAMKIVLGAGYGGYEGPPRIDRSWALHWVRGPMTAALLGIDPALGCGDPAMLWPFAAPLQAPAGKPPARQDAGRIGFMPHFESLVRGAWTEAAAAAGVRLIDPRADPRVVLAEIASCDRLVTEAMHGAIMADTLRVPWIAVRPLAAVHRAKWQDWAGALGMTIRFQQLPPSSPREWASVSRLASRRPVRGTLRLLAECGSRRLLERAADALRRIAAGPGQLSGLAALQRSQERMLTCLEAARRHPCDTRRPRKAADAALAGSG